MIRVHTANQGDINGMCEVDLRAYDYPLGYLEIKNFVTHPGEYFNVIAADDKHKVVGYAVFKRDSAAGTLEIVRLGVMPKHRTQGAGKELLRAGMDWAYTCKLYEVFVIIPECKCKPGDPDDVSRWLSYQGFTAIAPLLPCHFKMYGDCQDGIKFVKKAEA